MKFINEIINAFEILAIEHFYFKSAEEVFHSTIIHNYRERFRVIMIIAAALAILAVCIYFIFLRYPSLKTNPTVGKWYRVADSAMKDSEGNGYHALFKKGSENKVMVYFAGGGVSVNEETARDDTYNTRLVWPDCWQMSR